MAINEVIKKTKELTIENLKKSGTNGSSEPIKKAQSTE